MSDTAQNTETQLLPCPCCGGTAWSYMDDDCWIVECRKCNVRTSLENSREEAVAVWNCREPIAEAAKRLAEVTDLRQMTIDAERLHYEDDKQLEDPMTLEMANAESAAAYREALAAYRDAKANPE